MFNFPWSNFHELNLDWILNIVKEARDIFTHGEADIQHAVETAEQALETAEQAAQAEVGDGAITIPKLNDQSLKLLAFTVSGSVTDTAIPKNAMVIIRKSQISGITDGLYLAANAIPANTTLTSADLVQPSNIDNMGGFNYIINYLSEKTRFLLLPTGDTTDRISDIMYCLNTYGACVLADGEFYINGSINMPDGTSFSGLGVGTTLILKDNSTDSIAVNVGTLCSVENMTIKGHSTNLPYNAYTQGSRKGIALLGDYSDFNTGTYSHNYSKLSNLTIRDFDHSGIWCYRNDGAASFLAENIDILRCHTGVNIELFSEFSSFSNIRCRWCNIACVMQGGNNLFSNCHFDVNLKNLLCDGDNNTLVNASHSSFIGCSFCHPDNNSGYNLDILGQNNGLIFEGCNLWYGKIRIYNSTGVIISNCIIGGTNNDIGIGYSHGITIVNNIFKHDPVVNFSNWTMTWENNIGENNKALIYLSKEGSEANLVTAYKYNGSIYTTFENLGYCYSANTWRVCIPLPYIVNSSTKSFTPDRIVLRGLGIVSDLTSLSITIDEAYMTIDNIPYTGSVGSLCAINVRGTFTA